MNGHSPEKSIIGLALGSGAARGWAHIGVIRALSEMGIEPEVVAGSSVGALVGVAYASGQLDSLEEWCRSLTRKKIFGYLDVSLPRGGFIQGERLRRLVLDKVGDHAIESLPKKFGAVATDLETGQEVWIRTGSLLTCVRASMALPGIFPPVRLGGQRLVDGGLTNPVPVSLCRAMGADIVIAVNLNSDIVGKRSRNRPNYGGRTMQTGVADSKNFASVLARLKMGFYENKRSLLTRLFGENADSPGVFEIIANSINIMQDRITRARMAGDPPEVNLSPRLSQLGLLEFNKAAEAIEEGRECARSMQAAIENVLG